MIVVDSSVWVAELRNLDTDAALKLREIVGRTEVLIGDIVLLELLRGARTEAEAGRLEYDLRVYTIVEMLDTSIAIKAASNFRKLRQRGITIRNSIDLIIATFCMQYDYPLLQDDRDFLPMAQHLGLRLI